MGGGGYENRHTGERIQWAPTQPASTIAGASPDLQRQADSGAAAEATRSHAASLARQNGAVNGPGAPPAKAQGGWLRCCVSAKAQHYK